MIQPKRDLIPRDEREIEHDPDCAWEYGGAPCLRFSTDGTALGAEIAHTMGTTSEAEIILMGERDRQSAFVSDVEEEQADWDRE
jgi:hypothetical protein